MAGLALLAGVNLVRSATSDAPTDPARAAAPMAADLTSAAEPRATSAPSRPAATQADPTPPTAAGAAAVPPTTAPPPAAVAPAPVPTSVPPAATAVTEPPVGGPLLAFAGAAVTGVGCAAEPFAEGFARSGFTPDEVSVASCEIVLDVPGVTHADHVCAQMGGPPVARVMHVAQRTVDGRCQREVVGVIVHEVGHAWHMDDPVRFRRVMVTLGLDPNSMQSLEVVAECFVEAVGYLDTACTPFGVAVLSAEIAASRTGG
jgi:hypothetical protein